MRWKYVIEKESLRMIGDKMYSLYLVSCISILAFSLLVNSRKVVDVSRKRRKKVVSVCCKVFENKRLSVVVVSWNRRA